MLNTKILSIIVLIAALAFIWRLPEKKQMLLPIPFTSQAPTGNWDDNKDCEESSIAMVKAFFDGKTELTVQEAVEAIKMQNDWERTNLGYNRDTGADDTARMAKEVYGLRTELIFDFTADDLKRQIDAGNPVLLPINTGPLPKYSSKPAFYHMVVIKGYVGNRFIVNDPGTESGKDNEYDFQTLQNAAADWNHQTQSMEPNKKIALVLAK